MHRRNFIKSSALCAVAVSTSGFIRFDGNNYLGDCETTTDILGPFYRPDSPVRSNLLIKGDSGDLMELTGVINHKDCITPFKKAKVELWHCSSKGVYDNSSAEFRYRGTTYSDDKGHYSFQTILPVPYEVGGGRIRPAHFHLMITAEGYQPLVTQLYFTGDAHLEKDASSSSPTAKRRLLQIQTLPDGSKKVVFTVGMSDILAVEPTAINRLVGIYRDEKDKSQTMELFAKNNELWMKNEVYGRKFNYIGNNTFQWPEVRPGEMSTAQFEILASGSVKAILNFADREGKREVNVWMKEK